MGHAELLEYFREILAIWKFDEHQIRCQLAFFGLKDLF